MASKSSINALGVLCFAWGIIVLALPQSRFAKG
jgi:hypothetical protein